MIILTCLSLFGLTHAFSQDWPDWRGINRDGIWNDPTVVQEFESEQIAIKWSVPIGPGYSGPTVSNGRVYVTDRKENSSQRERVLCFDDQSGDSIWSFSYNSTLLAYLRYTFEPDGYQEDRKAAGR